MKGYSFIQKITVIVWLVYFIWEFSVWEWAKDLPPYDPVIRVDLIFIYPILAFLSGISIYQLFKSKR